MWGRIGEQPTVPAAGQNQRIPVFGALDACTGRLFAQVAERKNADAFRVFLSYLIYIYRGRHIFLFLDNSSIHHAKTVQRYLADHIKDITVLWNAEYAPQLNLIERYWGHLKAKAIHNYYFETKAALKTAIREAVIDMNQTKDLRMTIHLESLKPLRKCA